MGAGLHGGFGSTAGFKDAFAFEITVEFTENGYVFRKRKLDRKQIRRRQAEAESRVETASAKNGKKIGSESEKQKAEPAGIRSETQTPGESVFS